MSFSLLLLCLLALGVSYTGTRQFIRYATRTDLVDVPNHRSSHTRVIPRGAGLVFAAVFITLLIALSSLSGEGERVSAIFIVTITAVLLLGVFDDRLDLSAKLRLLIQLCAAGLLVHSLGPLPALSFVQGVVMSDGLALRLLCVLGLVWLLNLYNFMDGIDGLAALQAVFVSIAAAALSALSGDMALAASLLLLGATVSGFLLWNLPPARVFMGDAGSAFLGFVFGAFMMVSYERGGPAPWVWLILLGVFFVDTTVTLIRRTALGERPLEAHRTHAYQYLSRQLGSHAKVNILVLAINMVWLLPCALAAMHFTRVAALLMIVAWLPLIVASLLLRAGVPEAS